MQIRKLTSTDEIIEIFSTWGKIYGGYAVLDTETTGLNIRMDRIISYTVAAPSGDVVFYIEGSNLNLLRYLRVPLVCHNFKFDFGICYHNGVDLRNQGLVHDTMLLDHLLNEENDHDLDSIVKRYFNDNYKEMFWKKYKDISQATESDLIEYSGKDAGYTAKVYNRLMDRLNVPSSLLCYVRDFALSLYDTELKGIKVDLPYLNGIGTKLGTEIGTKLAQLRTQVDIECANIELEMYEVELDKRKTMKGKLRVKRPEFNFGSTLQLGKLLYDELELPERRNKQGNRTVDDGALESLEGLHPIVSDLRKLRELTKVKTAFIDGTLDKMVGNRIYPTINVNGTVTGRTSSSNPNMQQLPSRGGVRGIYVPDEGYVFLSYDYSQLEVTIAAHYSRDHNLLKIINEGASQHDITAEGLGVPRSTAKTINFALQYGAGAQKIQKILGCSIKDAEEALKKYWETYSGLRDFIKSCHETIEKGEPLINPFGRIRHLPTKKQLQEKFGDAGFYSRRDDKKVYKWEIAWNSVLRQGPNSLIQGTGADLTNTAFKNIDRDLKERSIGYALFPVHDEIIVAVKKEAVDETGHIMQNRMVSIGEDIRLTVPLKVEGSGPMARWED